MDLEKSWKEWGESEKLPDELLTPASLRKQTTMNPLQKLKRNMGINMVFGVVILFFYAGIIFLSPEPLVRLAMIAMLLFTLWAVLTTFRLYRSLDPALCSSCNLVHEMERYHSAILAWSRNQKKVAAFFYPVGAAGGFILGGSVGAGKPVADIMAKTQMQVALLVTVIILTPLAWLLANWMNRVAFGKYIDALGANLKALKGD
jgi:ribose/xylose/arabinose/galactoside ABC-type transport system permease subunit